MSSGRDELILEDLSKGLVTSAPPYKLEDGEARDLTNLFISLRGSLTLRGKLRYPAGISGFSSTIYITGFIRFRTGTTSYIVFGAAGGGLSGTFAFNEGTLTFTYLSPVILYDAICMDNRVIWISRGAGNVAWTWDGATVSTLGLAPPTSVMVAAVGAVGTLNNVDLPAYQWYVTFVNALGVESNPTQLSTPGGGAQSSNALDNVDNDSVNLTSIPTGPTGVVDRYIYRVGGLITRPTLVQTLGDNSTTSTNDNTADRFVGTVYLSNSHDTPPTGPEVLGKVKNRAIIAKGTTVYVSNLGEPDYYPANPGSFNSPLTDGIIFEMDNDLTNPVVAISESGSAGIIHRRRNAWILQGEDIDSFTLTKLCDIGIISRRTAVMCGNLYVWQAPDGMVWGLGSNGPEPLGLQIEDDLKNVPMSDRQIACACYRDRCYHLCVPRNAGVLPFYRVYSFVYNEWVDLSRHYNGATQLYNELGESDVDELLFATKSGYEDYYGATSSGNRGIAAAFGPSGIANFGFTWWSGDFDMGQPTVLKKAVHLKVWGTWMPSGSQSATATVRAVKERTDGGETISTASYPLTSGREGSRLETDVRASLNGQRLSILVTGDGDEFQLDGLLLGYTGTRQGGE